MKRQVICQWCNGEFETTSPIAKFCSKKCYKEHYKKKTGYHATLKEKRCTICHKKFKTARNCNSDKNLRVHHKIPLADGGTNKERNLETLCSLCHARKHRILLESSELLGEGAILNDSCERKGELLLK